jgi:hypothetical protein
MQCGTDSHCHCDKKETVNGREKEMVLSPDMLKKMNNLEIDVQVDFTAVLDGVKEKTGAKLLPRPEGFHVTVVGPTEVKVFGHITDEQVQELCEISEEVRSGRGVTVRGVGYIDGAQSEFLLREADKEKKTAFVALDIPRLQEFRQHIGLPPRYFHITLGFEGGDIHMRVTHKEEIKPGKFKDVTEFIPKCADSQFSDIADMLPPLRFGNLSGQKKEERESPAAQPIHVDTKKEKAAPKKYNEVKLRMLLTDIISRGQSGNITLDQVERIVAIALTNPQGLGRELRGDFRLVQPVLSACEEGE